MHLRCDGPLGFPGGIIEPNEDVLTGVTREVQEELGFNVQLSEEDYVARILQPYHRQKGDKTWDTLNSYFFAKEITEEDFKAMEINCYKAEHFGLEVMGNVRVPVHIRKDGQKGLPRFLQNHFAGAAQIQLLLSLAKAGILPEKDLISAFSVLNKTEY